MVTLTSRQVLDAVLCSRIATRIHKMLVSRGVGHAGRIEFQRRRSAHLHFVLHVTPATRGVIDDIKTVWLEGVGETEDAASQAYACHAQAVTGSPLYVLLYIAGHTTKADYQAVSPVPLRRWFWVWLDPIPTLARAEDADILTMRLLQSHYGQTIMPTSFGARVFAEDGRYQQAVDLALQWRDLGY